MSPAGTSAAAVAGSSVRSRCTSSRAVSTRAVDRRRRAVASALAIPRHRRCGLGVSRRPRGRAVRQEPGGPQAARLGRGDLQHSLQLGVRGGGRVGRAERSHRHGRSHRTTPVVRRDGDASPRGARGRRPTGTQALDRQLALVRLDASAGVLRQSVGRVPGRVRDRGGEGSARRARRRRGGAARVSPPSDATATICAGPPARCTAGASRTAREARTSPFPAWTCATTASRTPPRRCGS